MKIGINLLSIVTGGAEIYSVNLGKNLALLDKENLYEIFVPYRRKNQFAVEQDNFEFVELPQRLSIPYYRMVWEQIFLPVRVKRDGIDVLLSTGNADILFSPCKTVVTLQVIQPFAVPEMFPSKIKLLYLRTAMKLSAGASADLVDEGVNGYTFNPDDVNDLKEKLQLLLENKTNREEMGRQSL